MCIPKLQLVECTRSSLRTVHIYTSSYNLYNMEFASHTLLVISYYDRRQNDDLRRLLDSLAQFPAGDGYDVCVVVNSTSSDRISLGRTSTPVRVIYRENLGMNIGAWDHGWRTNRSYDDYLFLQDECYVVRDNWLTAFRQRAAEPDMGMVGESLNHSWDRRWEVLRKEQEGVLLPGHTINGKPLNRVDYYLRFFEEAGIDRGHSGRHLRSLVWYFRAEVLEQMEGFPQGRNYGECIAAEIGVSKRVESLGLRVEQLNDEAFRYIRHREWNQDYPGAPFTHSSTTKRRLEQLANPSWGTLGRLVMRKLSASMRREKG
jgi:hypothetical protein